MRITTTAAIIAALMQFGCGPQTPQSAQTAETAETAETADVAPPELPSFEFRGLKPDVTTMAEAVKSETVRYCSESGSCDFSKYGVGDVTTGRSMVIFTNGKFDWFSIKLSPRSFDDMQRTLSGVYGQPCRQNSEQLQNAFGAQFSGDEAEWCFKEGHLTLRRHSENDVTEGELDYFTTRDLPPAKTYDPGTL